jgi:transcriptional regulator with XRE-family HTH domain
MVILSGLSDKIKDLRFQKNWSQEDLARNIGVGQQYISRYESGKTKPSFKSLQKLAEAFEVPVDYLIGKGKTNLSGFNIKDTELLSLLAKLESLDEQDLVTIRHVIDAMIAKKQEKR